MVTRLVLIARVSTRDQRIALPGQERRLRRYAQEKGLPFEFHQFDESAYKPGRKKFAELIERIKQYPEYCAVVFDKTDRYSRDSTQDEVNAMTGLVRSGKLELHFPSENLIVHKNSSSDDRLRLGIGLVLAEHYSASVSDSVRRQFDDSRYAGRWTHQAPPGYLNHRTGEKETTVIVDPDRRRYIVRAYELRLEGMAYAEIANTLAYEGFIRRSGRKFTTKDLELILNNKFYFGVMTIKGVDYPHHYETIISRSLYNRVQAIKRHRGRAPTKYAAKTFMLSRIVKCERCGRSISPYDQKGRVYLLCANKRQCEQPSASQDKVIPALQADLAFCRIPDQYIARVIKSLKLRHDSQSSYFTQTLESNRKQYDKLKRRLDVLYEDRLDGRVSAEQYDEMAAGIQADQLELNEQAKNLTKDNTNFLITESRLLDLCQRAGELFDSSKPELQNELLEVMLSKCVLVDKKLDYTFHEPFDTVVRINKASATGGSEDANAINGWG